jgi:hypothetical protein
LGGDAWLLLGENMNNQITRKQHFVSRFYLAQWENANRQVVVHDLADDTTEDKEPKKYFLG